MRTQNKKRSTSGGGTNVRYVCAIHLHILFILSCWLFILTSKSFNLSSLSQQWKRRRRERYVCAIHSMQILFIVQVCLLLTYIIISINPPSPRMRRRRTENMLWVLYLHVIYPLLTIMLLTKCCYSFLTCCNKITNVEAHQEKVSIFHCHILSSANLMIVLDSQNNIYYIPHHATHTPLVLTCEHRTRRGVQVEAVPM